MTFDVLGSMFYTNSTHLLELVSNASTRAIDLRRSGFKTDNDTKEMILLEEKVEVVTNAMKALKDNGADMFNSSNTVLQLIGYMNSKDGKFKNN